MCGDFQLTRMQRFYGFGICFSVGFLISFISTFLLFGGNMSGFAVLYTIGNIVSLVATGFLTGFLNQFRKMFDATRLTATIAFLTTLILTLVSAFAFQIAVLTLVFCVIQYFALMWYSLSYIPFARDAVKGLVGIRS